MSAVPAATGQVKFKRWQCYFCGFIYDEALGFPDEGIAPGTAWVDIPEDWLCPDCGVGKSDFYMEEMQ
jgi:rubredoxin